MGLGSDENNLEKAQTKALTEALRKFDNNINLASLEPSIRNFSRWANKSDWHKYISFFDGTPPKVARPDVKSKQFWHDPFSSWVTITWSANAQSIFYNDENDARDYLNIARIFDFNCAFSYENAPKISHPLS